MHIKKIRLINHKSVGLHNEQSTWAKIKDFCKGLFCRSNINSGSVKCKDIRHQDLSNMGRASNTGQSMHCIQTEENGPIVVAPVRNSSALKSLYPDGCVIESPIKQEPPQIDTSSMFNVYHDKKQE